jgi:hypothetical protein
MIIKMRNCNTIMHNHSITKYLSTTHREEIEVEDEQEEDLDEARDQ